MGTIQTAEAVSHLLFGKTRFSILALLYARNSESFYLREISRSVGGGLGLMAIIAARVSRPEEVQEVAEAIRQAPAKGLRKQPRWLIVVDEDCDVTNWEDVMWRMTLGAMPHEHVRVRPPDQEILHEPLAHMYDFKGSSVVVDATFRTKRAVKHGRELTFPPVNRASRALLRRVESRWGEYGLD